MITHIQGRLVEKSPTEVVVDCQGVGYLIHISLNTFAKLPDGEAIRLYTHLQVREDAHTLYGFADQQERALFRLLISVSGIGASTARTLLSSLSPADACSAIQSENVAAIQSVKGIGLKTAQRVIIELRDKVIGLGDFDEFSAPQSNTNKEEALSALEVLGYQRKQAQKVLEILLKNDPEMRVEELIKNALKKI